MAFPLVALAGTVLGPIVNGFVKVRTTTAAIAGQTMQAGVRAFADGRAAKFLHWMGRLPLMVLEIVVVLYAATIFWDSVQALRDIMVLGALELPAWFKPYFREVWIGIVGLAGLRIWKQ